MEEKDVIVDASEAPTEEPVAAATVPTAAAATISAPVAAPADINFRNILAVRVSVLAASLTYMLSTLATFVARYLGAPVQFLAFMVSIGAAGFLAVYFYRRAGGHVIPAGGGARLGWMAGVFVFVITTVLFTLSAMLMAGEGGFAEFYKRSLDEMRMPEETMGRMREVLESPSVMAFLIMLVLGLQFAFMSILGAVGGAIGVRFFKQAGDGVRGSTGQQQ